MRMRLRRPVANETPAATYSRNEIVRAWVPWIILSACVFLWGLPQFRAMLDRASERSWAVPFLHQQIQPDAAIVGGDGKPKVAEFRFNWLSATGTGIMVAAICSAFWMGISPARFVRLFFHTLHRLRWPLFTIAAMLAIAYTTQYSGTDVTLGLAFTRTGRALSLLRTAAWVGLAWRSRAATRRATPCSAICSGSRPSDWGSIRF